MNLMALICSLCPFLCTGISQDGDSPNYVQKNEIPSRLAWNENFGYCGETSFITAGLYYGQYCSQYTARSLASPGVDQDRKGSQLLVGVNDVTAATAMCLNALEFDTQAESNTNDFLTWVKTYTLQNYPVIIGIFINECLFYGDSHPQVGDPDYDHIVTVMGIGSSHPLSDLSYYGDDRIYFMDNGLFSPHHQPSYFFDYGFDDFQANREQANARAGSIYSLNDDASNYGVAILGVLDTNGDTIPVCITTDINDEIPEIVDGTAVAPSPCTIQLTVTVTIADQTKSYNLHYYNSFTDVPSSHFNTSGNPTHTWIIPPNSGPTYTLPMTIQSDEIAVFRAVPTTAP